MPTQIDIVLFPGFDELDAIGPFEVFANGARAGANLDVRLVSLEPTETIAASHGLVVEPDGVLGEPTPPDILVVPGGGWSSADGGVRRAVDDGALLEAIADQAERGGTLASVCTGAMALAHAGVLEGRPAVTHHSALADLEAFADVREARVVDDGDLLTGGGVTSGIDLALWVLEREWGAEIADQVAREMEHERRGAIVRA